MSAHEAAGALWVDWRLRAPLPLEAVTRPGFRGVSGLESVSGRCWLTFGPGHVCNSRKSPTRTGKLLRF